MANNNDIQEPPEDVKHSNPMDNNKTTDNVNTNTEDNNISNHSSTNVEELGNKNSKNKDQPTENPSMPFGLINPRAFCYLNSIIQCLYACREFRKEFMQKSITDSGEEQNKFALSLQNLFKRINEGDNRNIQNAVGFLQKFFKDDMDGDDINSCYHFIINSLHRVFKEQEPVNEGDDRLSRLKKKNKGFIADYFMGIQQYRTYCTKCRKNCHIDPQLLFSISINPYKSVCKIEELIKTNLESKSKLERHVGSKCCNDMDLEICTEIIQLPKYLFIYIVRGSMDHSKPKNTTFYKFDDAIFVKDSAYRVRSVIDHMGSSSGGHYYVKIVRNGKWTLASDSQIEEIHASTIQSPNATGLMLSMVGIDDDEEAQISEIGKKSMSFDSSEILDPLKPLPFPNKLQTGNISILYSVVAALYNCKDFTNKLLTEKEEDMDNVCHKLFTLFFQAANVMKLEKNFSEYFDLLKFGQDSNIKFMFSHIMSLLHNNFRVEKNQSIDKSICKIEEIQKLSLTNGGIIFESFMGYINNKKLCKKCGEALHDYQVFNHIIVDLASKKLSLKEAIQNTIEKIISCKDLQCDKCQMKYKTVEYVQYLQMPQYLFVFLENSKSLLLSELNVQIEYEYTTYEYESITFVAKSSSIKPLILCKIFQTWFNLNTQKELSENKIHELCHDEYSLVVLKKSNKNFDKIDIDREAKIHENPKESTQNTNSKKQIHGNPKESTPNANSSKTSDVMDPLKHNTEEQIHENPNEYTQNGNSSNKPLPYSKDFEKGLGLMLYPVVAALYNCKDFRIQLLSVNEEDVARFTQSLFILFQQAEDVKKLENNYHEFYTLLKFDRPYTIRSMFSQIMAKLYLELRVYNDQTIDESIAEIEGIQKLNGFNGGIVFKSFMGYINNCKWCLKCGEALHDYQVFNHIIVDLASKVISLEEAIKNTISKKIPFKGLQCDKCQASDMVDHVQYLQMPQYLFVFLENSKSLHFREHNIWIKCEYKTYEYESIAFVTTFSQSILCKISQSWFNLKTQREISFNEIREFGREEYSLVVLEKKSEKKVGNMIN